MKKGYIYIDDNIFESLLAISTNEQEKGLMGVEWPPPIMSFLYKEPKINKFWMHNTPSPLDIVFCNNGKINQICKGIPFSTEIIGDNTFSDIVIELPYGTCQKLGIKVNSSAGFIKK